MKERYERALGIALGRLGVPALAQQVGDPALVRFIFDAAEADLDREAAQALQDIQRLVNVLEAIERAEGIPHVRVRRSEADERAHGLLARMEALGYQVHVYPSTSYPGQWEAAAFYQGRMVGFAREWSKARAVEGLAMEVGLLCP